MVIRLRKRKPLEQVRKIAGGAGWWYFKEVPIFDNLFPLHRNYETFIANIRFNIKLASVQHE